MKNIILITKPSKKAKDVEQLFVAELGRAKVTPKRTIVVATGGDGTLLYAVKKFIHDDVCFVGISAGSLGFMQTIEPAQIPQLVKALGENSFSTIKAPLLCASYVGDNKEPISYGFNDVIVERSGPRAAKFGLHIGDASGNFIGDGVIFGTPLGSTAYSLSAGGPIIDSRSEDVFVVTPNNPHISALYSSLQRPHVLQKGRVVQVSPNVEELAERPLQLSVDGSAVVEPILQPIEISLSDKTIEIVEIAGGDFHSRIDSKRLGQH